MYDMSGNRGWRLEIWKSDVLTTFDDLDGILDMDETMDGYSVSYIEEAKYSYDVRRHVARLSGYFVAPDSGKFTFSMRGRRFSKMYLTVKDTRVCRVRLVIRLCYLSLHNRFNEVVKADTNIKQSFNFISDYTGFWTKRDAKVAKLCYPLVCHVLCSDVCYAYVMIKNRLPIFI